MRLTREMTKILALVRASALTALSYRLRIVFSFFGLLVSLVPLFLVAEALQPTVSPSIQDEGEQYFGFLILGLIATLYVGFAIRSVTDGIASGISSGTLEALFATPTSLPVLLAGLVGYGFVQNTIRSALMLAAIPIAGQSIAWSGLPLGVLILGLIILCYLAVGLMGAALHLVFRTSGPLIAATVTVSTLLGGVYYSVSVIPEIVRPLALVVPLTYGLRGLRRSVLQGLPIEAIYPDLMILLTFTVVLLTVGVTTFRVGLKYAKRAGTLAQY